MRKILIISNENCESIKNFHGSEAIRIFTYYQHIFAYDTVYILSSDYFQLKIRSGQIVSSIKVDGRIRKLIDDYRIDAVVIFQNSHFNSLTYKFALQNNKKTKIIIDLYNPLLIEKSTYNSDQVRLQEIKEAILKIISSGDFFICANNRQFNLYLGMLISLGKIINFSPKDIPLCIIPTILPLRNLSAHALIRKKFDFLFFGGFYPWFDEKKAIMFTKQAIAKGANITFLGIKNPFTKGIFNKEPDDISREFANSSRVHIKEWMDYKELQAEIPKYRLAVNFVKSTMEDFFANRTRLLSLLQAGIPVITSGRDEISEEIIKTGAGFYEGNMINNMAEILKKVGKIKKNCKSLYRKLSLINSDEKQKIELFMSSAKNSNSKDHSHAKIFVINQLKKIRTFFSR